MDSTRLAELTAWIAAHPQAAGGVIFAAAFLDALLVIGAVVPAIPIFFAVGTLVGLGSIDGAYAIVAAAAGAFCGDGLSYLLGRRYGERLRGMWPFSRYPHWLERGESLFERHGAVGLLIARYVGAVRPFVPAIAGMLGMPAQRYAFASATAGLSWAALFIGPGWLFGASMDVLSAIAGRLSLLLLAIALILLTTGWLVARGYALLAPRTNRLVELALRWSHRHPFLGQLSRGLVDPQHPESTSLAWFALTLLGTGLGGMWLAVRLQGSAGIDLDAQLGEWMLQLRSPLADPLIAWLSPLAGATGLAMLGVAMTLAFVLRGHRLAAAHFAAAVGVGLLFDLVLDAALAPSTVALTSLAAQSGLLAVLLARSLSGRHRIAPYLAAALLTMLPAAGALYVGADPLTPLLARAAIGLAWAAALGLGFRRRHASLPTMRPWSAVWLVALLAIQITLASPVIAPPALSRHAVSTQDWLAQSWSDLPTSREDFTALRPSTLDLQFAGSLDELAAVLQAHGWQRLPPPGWSNLLSTLDGGLEADDAAPLPAAHLGQREALVMRHRDSDADTQQVLRLWPSAWELENGLPIWQGAVIRLHFEERLGLFRGWFPHEDDLHGLPLDRIDLPADWTCVLRAGAAGPVQLLQSSSVAKFR